MANGFGAEYHAGMDGAAVLYQLDKERQRDWNAGTTYFRCVSSDLNVATSGDRDYQGRPTLFGLVTETNLARLEFCFQVRSTPLTHQVSSRRRRR